MDINGFMHLCKRERLFKVDTYKDLLLYKLDNNIVVVVSKKDCLFKGKIGDKIKKNEPWITVDGEEYTYERDITIIETEKTYEYRGIIKID